MNSLPEVPDIQRPSGAAEPGALDQLNLSTELKKMVRRRKQARDPAPELPEGLDRHHRELNTEIVRPTKIEESLQATLRRTQTQLQAVGRLSRVDALTSSDVESFAREVTEVGASTIGCERVNVWLFNDDETELHCIDHFEKSNGRHSAGMVLNEREFQNEFQVLRHSRYVDADDPLTDPRTSGYVDSYLKPLRITAMLDAVIQSAGKNLGLLCFEHVDRPHHWEQDEIAFACQLADKIGLTLLNRMRTLAEEKLRASEAALKEAQAIACLGNWAFDYRAKQATWSNETFRIFGVDPQTFTPTCDQVLERIHPDDRASVERTYADAVAALSMESPAIISIDYRIVCDDGGIKVVHERARIFGDEEGHPVSSIGTVQDITERKGIEEKLHFANALLAAQLDGSPDGILVVDENRRITLVNRRFGEMWRIPQDVVAAGSDDVVLNAAAAQVKDIQGFRDRIMYLNDHPEEVGSDEIEFKDDRVYERYSVALRDTHENYLGRVWFFSDMTARKKAENALRQERDFSAALIESLPGFFVLIDQDGRFARWNENVRTLTGLSDEQLSGCDSAAIVAEIDRDMVRPNLQEAFEHGRADVEFRMVAKDGNMRSVYWSGRTLTREGRCYLLAVGSDVTKAREAEMRLRASEERFRAVSETAQDAIIMVDNAGRVTMWNPAAERILGYTASEAAGRNVHDWLAPARFREEADAGMKEFAATGRGSVLQKTVELAAIRKDGTEIPIELSVAGMRLGADWHAIAILRDITERKLAEEQISRMARHDVLTGLPNRAVFVEALEQAIALARRGGKPFAVLYLDLDHFKDVNDTLGHPIGDLLLQSVAQRLQANIRESDTAARFGGDEFALIETDIGEPADAAVLADTLLRIIKEPFTIQGNVIRTGSSVGIAVYGPDSLDAEALLSHADVALYRAKSEGRGTYRFFTDAMDTEVRSRVTLAAELRDAIDCDQLRLVYQPQVDVDTGRIAGVEALVRWQHPRRGLISPDEFIPVAESSGLIVALGHWVLHEACRQAKEWLDDGIALPLIAVNVSGVQFKRQFELEHDIATILAETGLPPQCLELELTESVLMEASRDHEVLLRLRKRGLRIAIDDFGTGYSSLQYLGRFPVDRVKIAQTFIVGLTPGSSNATIVKAAIGLARDLERNVIVEGVETAEQLAMIRSWGCRDVQGFYFSKPLPAQEVAVLLRARRILPAQSRLIEPAA